MLAQIWKKVLLAVCIVACLFNITSKLVNKTSLEKNLNSINNDVSFSDFLKSFDLKGNSNTVDDTTSTSSTTTDTVTEGTTDASKMNNEDNSEYVIIY